MIYYGSDLSKQTPVKYENEWNNLLLQKCIYIISSAKLLAFSQSN